MCIPDKQTARRNFFRSRTTYHGRITSLILRITVRGTRAILIRDGGLSPRSHPELYRETRYEERLSSRTLDRAVRAPGCSRAVSKWILRSHECESTCIIETRYAGGAWACTRDFLCKRKRACYPSERVVGAVRWRPAVRTPLAYRDIIYPHMSIYGPSIRGDGSVGHRGRSATPMPSHRETADSCPLSRPSLWVGGWNIRLTSVTASYSSRSSKWNSGWSSGWNPLRL